MFNKKKQFTVPQTKYNSSVIEITPSNIQNMQQQQKITQTMWNATNNEQHLQTMNNNTYNVQNYKQCIYRWIPENLDYMTYK